MADLGVNKIEEGSRLDELRKKQQVFKWNARLNDIEIRREEINIELARLEKEEESIRKNLKEHEGVKET